MALGKDGNWTYLDYRLNIPEGTRRVVKASVLGKIPWRNIRKIDPGGDHDYRGPHLFCSYADNRMPYERVVASVMGELHDSLLDPAKQHEHITAPADLNARMSTTEPSLEHDGIPPQPTPAQR